MRNKHLLTHWLTWGKLKAHLTDDKISLHFNDYNWKTYPNLVSNFNDNARISTIYIGTDGLLHIIFLDEYKGEKYNES